MEAGSIITYPLIPSIDFVSHFKKKIEAGNCHTETLKFLPLPSSQQHKIFAVPAPTCAPFLHDPMTEMFLPNLRLFPLFYLHSDLFFISFLSLIHVVNTHYVPDTIFDSGEMMGNKTSISSPMDLIK